MKSKGIESCSSRLAACPTGSSNGLHARLAQWAYFCRWNNEVANDIVSKLGIEGQSRRSSNVSVEADALSTLSLALAFFAAGFSTLAFFADALSTLSLALAFGVSLAAASAGLADAFRRMCPVIGWVDGSDASLPNPWSNSTPIDPLGCFFAAGLAA